MFKARHGASWTRPAIRMHNHSCPQLLRSRPPTLSSPLPLARAHLLQRDPLSLSPQGDPLSLASSQERGASEDPRRVHLPPTPPQDGYPPLHSVYRPSAWCCSLGCPAPCQRYHRSLVVPWGSEAVHIPGRGMPRVRYSMQNPGARYHRALGKRRRCHVGV